MIMPDVNGLVHAHNADSALHNRARLWWDACLSGTEGIGPTAEWSRARSRLSR
jgi:predicted nucleic acid-binding protein